MTAADPGSAPLDELADDAAAARVAVVGGGVAGLVAALECAKVGIRVTLFEASGSLGGTARTVELDGLPVDLGTDSLTPALDGLVHDLGLGSALVAPQVTTRWVAGLAGGDAAPLPDDTILGIPENMFSEASRRILGVGGTWRAYLDRLRPPLTIGHEQNLAKLVRTRMGHKTLDRLVAPLTSGVYGTTPEVIDVDLAAPGLNAALTRTGSLSGAVAAVRGEAPGARGLVGGMSRLTDALAQRLERLGAVVRVDAAVTVLERTGDAWTVHTDDAELDTTAGPPAPQTFDAVIVACDEAAARGLLAPVVPALEPEPSAPQRIETVALVVDAAALDGQPRGAEVVTVPGSGVAAGAVHLTAKWGWLARLAGPGRHVVRVAFPAPAVAGLGDAEAAQSAREAASALFGVAFDPTRVRASHRARFTLAPPFAVQGRRALAARARAAVEAVPGLAVTGGWLSGSGLAQVVPDAAATADRVRRRAVFGEDAAAR